MVVIESVEGRYVPLIQCDSCGKIIADAGDGLAAQKTEMQEGERIRVLYVHKGRCFQTAQSKLGNSGRVKLEPQELTRHLHYLAHNMGMNRVDTVINNIELDLAEGY